MNDSSGSQRLEHRSLAKQVGDDIIRRIVRRQLSSGEALPGEQSLAAEYNVSRPIVREALRALEGQGYIEIFRGRPAVVAEPCARTLENFFTWVLHGNTTGWTDLMGVRRVLEIESARTAARNRSDADITALREILAGMETARQDPEEYNQLDIQLHIAIARAGGNGFLVYLIEGIRGSLIEILAHLRIHLPVDLYAMVQLNHEEICTAIAERQEERAAAAMTAHFADIIDRLGRVPPDTQ